MALANAYIESFNGTLRAECLGTHWFGTLEEAKETIEAWLREYNTRFPHSALGYRSPVPAAYRALVVSKPVSQPRAVM